VANYGSVSVDDCEFAGNSGREGAAIFLGDGGSMTITDSNLHDNNSGSNRAGAIYVGGYGATLNMSGTTLADNTASNLGGAIWLNGTANLDECVVSGNYASGNGGAVCVNTGAFLSLTDTTVTGNGTAASGGAVYANAATVEVEGCALNSNYANGTAGGALFIQSTPLNIAGTVLAGNRATNGGAIYAPGSAPVQAVNCTFSGNRATNGDGGAIFFDYSGGSANTVMNCTFAGNRASGAGGAIRVNNRTLTVTNSILWGNYADGSSENQFSLPAYPTPWPTVKYSDIDQDYSGKNWDGGNNIGNDPQYDPEFVDPVDYTSAPTADGDYHLTADSIDVIDAGTSSGAPDDDIDGDDRPQPPPYDGYDMGSDEYVDPPVGGMSLEMLYQESEPCAGCHMIKLDMDNVDSSSATITEDSTGTTILSRIVDWLF
jgi:predicted outer membrane repeat protein